MKPTHLLVDLENVQPEPEELRSFLAGPGAAWVFHNASHKKLLPPLQASGVEVTCVPTSRPGKNSLDFHLVLYLGYLAARNNHCQFVVLSGDKGYDPAIEHALTLGLDVVRRETLGAKKPATKASKPKTKKAKKAAKQIKEQKKANQKAAKPTKTPPAKKTKKEPPSALDRVLKDLHDHPKNRPSKRKALERHITTLLGKKASPEIVSDIVSKLEQADLVKVTKEKLEYNIPKRNN